MKSPSKTWINVIVFLAALLLFSALQLRTAATVKFEEDALVLEAPKDFSLTIGYDRIAALELTEQTDPGTAVSGDENGKYRWGRWENDAWGEYALCVLKEVDAVIRITTLEGETVIFNCESEDTTTAMHEMFTELLAHREY